MRPAPLIAGALMIAAAAMTVVAITSGDGGGKSQRAAAPPAAVSDGQAVFSEHGCGSCHRFAAAGATGTLGPDLASSLRRMPAASIKEAIVAPSVSAAAGYGVGMMPEDYAARIPPDDLDALVGFLRDNARGAGE